MICKNLLLALTLLLSIQSLFAIEAAISYAAFQSPDQPYVEVYLRVNGSSLAFRPYQDSLFQAKASVELQFVKDGQVVLLDQFQMSGPPARQALDFVALERYALAPGQYELLLKLSDATDAANFRKYRADFELSFTAELLAQSDISLLADLHPANDNGLLVRNGMYMEPSPYRFYGPTADRLFFYHEIYHTESSIGQDFVLTYAIESIQNGESRRLLETHKRQSPAGILPLYGQLDISKLASGLYQLAIEVRDAQKRVLSRKTAFFERSNPDLWRQADWLVHFDPRQTFVGALNEDSLSYSLRALSPRLPSADMESVNWILKKKDVRAMQAYLMAYWSGQYAPDPERYYRAYMEVARAIDLQFNSGFRYGFETDRGYIYLKYGPPTEIEGREDEPSAPPYEVWTYDRLTATKQNNVRFIFYNPSLAPGDYVLLHSTARGERQQPQWQRILYRNAPNEADNDDFLEGTEIIDNFHRSGRRVFGGNY